MRWTKSNIISRVLTKLGFIHEKVLEIDFALGVEVFIASDFVAVNRTEITFGAHIVVHLGRRGKKDHETDNGQRDNDGPQPGLMLTNRSKHNIKGSQATRLSPLRSNAKSLGSARCDYPENWIKSLISEFP